MQFLNFNEHWINAEEIQFVVRVGLKNCIVYFPLQVQYHLDLSVEDFFSLIKAENIYMPIYQNPPSSPVTTGPPIIPVKAA